MQSLNPLDDPGLREWLSQPTEADRQRYRRIIRETARRQFVVMCLLPLVAVLCLFSRRANEKRIELLDERDHLLYQRDEFETLLEHGRSIFVIQLPDHDDGNRGDWSDDR